MPQNTTVSNPGVDVGYQNPGTTNLVLDGEVVGPDPVTGTQLTREFVVPQESINANDPLWKLVDLMQKMLSELKNIRMLLESDVVPGTISVMTELENDTGAEEATEEGIEAI